MVSTFGSLVQCGSRPKVPSIHSKLSWLGIVSCRRNPIARAQIPFKADRYSYALQSQGTMFIWRSRREVGKKSCWMKVWRVGPTHGARILAQCVSAYCSYATPYLPCSPVTMRRFTESSWDYKTAGCHHECRSHELTAQPHMPTPQYVACSGWQCGLLHNTSTYSIVVVLRQDQQWLVDTPTYDALTAYAAV